MASPQRPPSPMGDPGPDLPTLVILPTYQEAANVVGVLQRIRAETTASVLVVDDGSPDGTADLAEDAGRRLGSVDVLRRPGKYGLGSAYLEGFAWGLQRGFEVLVEMDADGSHDPADLLRLVAAVRGGADLCIGSRYVPGGAIDAWTRRRRFLSRLGNAYARTCLRLEVADMTAGFRAYRSSLLRRMELRSVRADGYGFQIEMTRLARTAGGRVTEIPIRFVDRTAGRSKMSGRIVAEALLLVSFLGVRDRLGALVRRRRAAGLAEEFGPPDVVPE